MAKKKSPTNRLIQLKTQLAKYRKQYDNLRKQSPDRWWHDEHFDNQVKVLDTVITDVKAQLMKSKKTKSNLAKNYSSTFGRYCRASAM